MVNLLIYEPEGIGGANLAQALHLFPLLSRYQRMIVQKHKHLNGSVAFMRFLGGGYNCTIEYEDPQTEEVFILNHERFMRHVDAEKWMNAQRRRN